MKFTAICLLAVATIIGCSSDEESDLRYKTSDSRCLFYNNIEDCPHYDPTTGELRPIEPSSSDHSVVINSTCPVEIQVRAQVHHTNGQIDDEYTLMRVPSGRSRHESDYFEAGSSLVLTPVTRVIVENNVTYDIFPEYEVKLGSGSRTTMNVSCEANHEFNFHLKNTCQVPVRAVLDYENPNSGWTRIRQTIQPGETYTRTDNSLGGPGRVTYRSEDVAVPHMAADWFDDSFETPIATPVYVRQGSGYAELFHGERTFDPTRSNSSRFEYRCGPEVTREVVSERLDDGACYQHLAVAPLDPQCRLAGHRYERLYNASPQPFQDFTTSDFDQWLGR